MHVNMSPLIWVQLGASGSVHVHIHSIYKDILI